MAWPMTKEAASEHSHRTAAAISSGVPIRPIGSCAITLSRPSVVPPVNRVHHLGVDDPGQTALIRKPLGVSRLAAGSTGVVECDVETPERVDRLVQCSLHILGPGYVATDGESTAAEFLDHPGRVLVALVGHIGQHHAGTTVRTLAPPASLTASANAAALSLSGRSATAKAS